MMKKILMIACMLIFLTCIFVISVGAASVVYKTEGGEEVFSYETGSGNVISNTNGAFPKTDSEGNALIWYVFSTKTEGGATVKTVKSFKALGETGDVKGEIDSNGKYSVSGIAGSKIVSLNLPDDSGIKLINIDLNGGYTGSFPRDSQILFAYLPNTLEEYTGNGGGGWTAQRFFQYTPILECYFSNLDMSNSNHMKTIGNFDFYGCRNLRVCVLPEGITTIYGNDNFNDGPAFRECYSLKEIVIPNSVTTIGPRAFENSGLVTVRFGANSSAANATWLLNNGSHSLRYVYLPGNTFSGSYLFNTGTSDMVFFYTGTFEQYTKLKNALSSNNAKFTGAIPIEWDSKNDDQFYKNLATNENKCYVVYNYGKCEAFYGGHSWKGETAVTVTSLFEKIIVGDTCKNCGSKDIKETINPIFKWNGYSASTFGDTLSVVQGYFVDHDALRAYMVYNPSFEYGFVATVNHEKEAISPVAGEANVISHKLTNGINNYIDIKAVGIPLDRGDTLIVFCVYALVDNEIYYLDNGKSDKTVLGYCYDDIK